MNSWAMVLRPVSCSITSLFSVSNLFSAPTLFSVSFLKQLTEQETTLFHAMTHYFVKNVNFVM